MSLSEHTDPRTSTEIIKDRLYFCALSRAPVDTASSHFFTVDDVLRYENFFNDFGPLNINLAYKFCQILLGKLAAPELANKTIYFYAHNRPQNRSNAAVLVGIYLIVYGGRTSAQAYEPLRALEPYMPFRDASQGLCTFRLMPQHCLRAVAKALRLGWLDFDNWNSAMYEHFESVENGDCCVLVPGKFLAFAGPHSTNVTPEGYPALTPADYVPIFRMYGVTTIIRLNKKCYERRDFLQAGFAHHDLYHPDGTTPSPAIAEKFLAICENATGMIGVHCKAGLGRTGTTIGLYLMKHYLLSAAEAIAWMRLCRPGCVIGPQQHYLKLQEPRMHKLGKSIGAVGAVGVSAASSVASSVSGSSAASASSSNASSLHSTPVRARQAPAPLSGSASSSSAASAASMSAAAAAAAAHPSPTPSYAHSQPPSPLSQQHSPSGSGGQSYSASFDTPPSMYQQRIGTGGAGAHRTHRQTPGSLSGSSHSVGASPAAPSGPQTRSVTSAAAAALQALQRAPASGLSSTLNTRGRSKAPRELSYTSGDSAAAAAAPSRYSPISAKSPLQKLPGVASPASPASPTGPRNLFDSKSWIQNSQRRAPSATGLRRGASSSSSSSSSATPTSAGGGFGLHMTAPVSPSQLASLGSHLPAPNGVKTKTTRSSSQLGFRQSKTKSKV